MANITVQMLASVFVAFSCFQSHAWSSGGHMLIAAEAYHELSPKLKSKVTELLKAHPEYETWVGSFRPDRPDLDLGTFVFMKASTWPDEIRRRHNNYDHPHWHYVDYPLKPPSFPMEPGPAPNDDALYGIAQCEKALSNHGESLELRAVYLSYLIHLVGDIHQPLHCGTLFNATYPDGDKGGNDFYVRPNSRGIKLHALWDDLLGTSSKPGAHLNYAFEIEKQHPRRSLKELSKSRTPKEWSLESRAVAIDVVYLRGELRGSTNPQTATASPNNYPRTAKSVAERQAALAGYRLAEEIQKCVK